MDTDQRALPRPIDGDNDGTTYCDVGAYEKQLPAPVSGNPESVDKIGIVAPWLGLVGLIAVAVIAIVLPNRKRAT